MMILIFGGFKDFLADTYLVTAYFPNAAGTAEGTPVRLRGIEIGRVRTIALAAEYGVMMKLDIRESVKIQKDAPLAIRQEGFIANIYLEFGVGKGDEIAAAGQYGGGAGKGGDLRGVRRAGDDDAGRDGDQDRSQGRESHGRAGGARGQPQRHHVGRGVQGERQGHRVQHERHHLGPEGEVAGHDDGPRRRPPSRRGRASRSRSSSSRRGRAWAKSCGRPTRTCGRRWPTSERFRRRLPRLQKA